MSVNVLFSATAQRWNDYRGVLADALAAAGVSARLSDEMDPGEVDYIVYAPNGPVRDFSGFPRLKAVLCLFAGVETIVANATLTVPLTRMVDSGLREGMVEWVTGHVLRYHLDMDRHITCQDGGWRPVIPPLARQRSVGILGLGELGGACACALGALNFQVSGWSRSPANIPNVTCHHGPQGLNEVLGKSEILVLLLPLTGETENLVNSDRLSLLPKGVRLINPGRGRLIDDDALLAALASDHVAHATLDVFRTEPLPASHPFWAHPKVTVTPHLASETRPVTASNIIAVNIRNDQAGLPMQFVVDRNAGY
jgi:glyoxylate/hydroxypyruvate reductase